MITALEIVFWVSVALTLYPYVVYPLLLSALVRLAPRRASEPAADARPPNVTVIVSAHNEAEVIEQKIRTTLACDYPKDKLFIVVVSDASTDATNDIVQRIAQATPNVKLLALTEHAGKTSGLNVAMETIESDIVIFTDANAIFDVAAIRELAERFQDPAIGYVVGAALYERNTGSTAGENEGLYWRYELAIKKLESAFDSVVGGDGAIYAVRRELYKKLAPEDINDFVNPLQVIAQGFRGVFWPAARAFEAPANDYGKEFRRKRRIVCRSWGALLRYAGELRLLRLPRFLFMLVSHKVIRWLTMLWILLAFIANIALIWNAAGVLYILTLWGFVILSALAAVGWWLARKGDDVATVVALPYYFLMANLAAFLGMVDYARGNRYITWEHVRSV